MKTSMSSGTSVRASKYSSSMPERWFDSVSEYWLRSELELWHHWLELRVSTMVDAPINSNELLIRAWSIELSQNSLSPSPSSMSFTVSRTSMSARSSRLSWRSLESCSSLSTRISISSLNSVVSKMPMILVGVAVVPWGRIDSALKRWFS